MLLETIVCSSGLGERYLAWKRGQDPKSIPLLSERFHQPKAPPDDAEAEAGRAAAQAGLAAVQHRKAENSRRWRRRRAAQRSAECGDQVVNRDTRLTQDCSDPGER